MLKAGMVNKGVEDFYTVSLCGVSTHTACNPSRSFSFLLVTS